MTKDKTVTMPRELARLLYQDTVSCWGLGGNAANQLSAILSAPVVERQDPVAWEYKRKDQSEFGKPTRYVAFATADLEECRTGKNVEGRVVLTPRDDYFDWRPLAYASPPAPVAVSMSAQSSPSDSIIVDHTCPICGDKSGHMGWACTKQKTAPVVVPEGWKLVPIEPTTKMLEEGMYSWSFLTAEPQGVWQEMLKAAPEYCLDKVKELNQ